MKKQNLIIILGIVVSLASIASVVWIIQSTKDMQKSPRTTSLQIREWGVTLPSTSTIADIYYTYNASSSETYISTRQLDILLGHIDGCTSGLHGLYYKKTADKPLALVEQYHIEPLCAVPANDETAQIGTIQADIRTAVQSATLN